MIIDQESSVNVCGGGGGRDVGGGGCGGSTVGR